MLALLVEQQPLVVGGFLAATFVLGLILIVWAWRSGGARPTPAPPPPPPAPSTPHLESPNAPPRLRYLDLKPGGVTIGREPGCDLVVTQDFPAWQTVSRRHAHIYQRAGRWIVEDLDSMNGIYVNGRRTGRNTLRDGWRLDVGGVAFIFHAGKEES